MHNDVGIIGVETVKENEDGSATIQFHFDADVRASLANYGLELIIYCAAAKMDMQKVFDYIRDHMDLTEYELEDTNKKCVSCGGPATKDDWCSFCLEEE